MKEMVVDCRRSQSDHSPLNINGSNVKIVKSTKFLGVHLVEDLAWSLNTSSITRKAQQCDWTWNWTTPISMLQWRYSITSPRLAKHPPNFQFTASLLTSSVHFNINEPVNNICPITSTSISLPHHLHLITSSLTPPPQHLHLIISTSLPSPHHFHLNTSPSTPPPHHLHLNISTSTSPPHHLHLNIPPFISTSTTPHLSLNTPTSSSPPQHFHISPQHLHFITSNSSPPPHRFHLITSTSRSPTQYLHINISTSSSPLQYLHLNISPFISTSTS
ncbi:hypothetical protein QTP70_004084 [Hemibagrus guttatus]|uniref:Uncharacterized protein n=1 Tax=Hemibagrus guttatus TaxID=175788 RepID=A0AAE0QEE7_9TELE|nr:hypothetical protein QTP70_004084 [Hemibagrus guttatus]KAK3546798.1 hypothetical protein QTP86_002909 [Hemibagrus guttatus]